MAHSPLTTPTYDGSGTATHPSVVKVGDTYWMAMTPHVTTTPLPTENPSILTSTDYEGPWAVPEGLTNPVVAKPAPTNAHNSDPDLLYEDGTFYLYWRERDDDSGVEHLKLITSEDGITWSSQTTVLTTASYTKVSPAVVRLGATWYLWTAHVVTASDLILRTSDGPTGPWSDPTTCTLPLGEGRTIWHLEVVRDRGLFRALVLTRNEAFTDLELIAATSVDGITWLTTAAVITGDGTWPRVYRAAMLREGDTWHVWHGIQQGGGGWAEWTWRIAYSTLDATDFPAGRPDSATAQGAASAWPSLRPT